MGERDALKQEVKAITDELLSVDARLGEVIVENERLRGMLQVSNQC